MDGNGEGVAVLEPQPSSSGVSCSICLDLVLNITGGRSRAKLQCGHEFHLDCIGSAFNMKGAMQCPNCRKVEKGQWLYANGSARSFPESSMDDWNPDEDPYDLNYPEMPFRVHWCPFGELARIPTSFEEVESPSTTYHDMREHHGMPSEHTAPSSLPHSYVAYFGPIPHASSRSSDSIDDPNFNYPWNGLSGHNDIFNPHSFPAISIQYHTLGRHSPPFSQFGSHINGADPASIQPATQGSTHSDSDATTRSRSFPYPLVFAHGSGPRAGSSFVSSAVPRYPGSNVHTHEMIQVSHAFHLQQRPSNSLGMPSPIIPAVRRIDSPGGLPPVVPASLQPDGNGGFHIYPPQTPSVPNLHEAENPLPNQFHAWEREHFSRFPPVLSDMDSAWGQYHHAAGDSDSVNRSGGLWHRRWP
ncbi:E3 ubiquitin-protein ligase RFI2-like isoform X1 [Quercus lobata]|uniref:E3 ubiquitin-protein ligase RFI2-like isoform X1 n=1 Tax=Quercus lobata TaxID=97700 RepID=UPI00124949CF|nr:E3 ubiquitin-protein ligase RFI2-like isoform X1 [Quercus lobata]